MLVQGLDAMRPMLPPGDLAVLRVPAVLLDREAFSAVPWTRLPGLDVGQDDDLRCSLGYNRSLHVQPFVVFPAPYLEAHIDVPDPLRDVAAHAVEATYVAPGAIAGVILSALTGSWLPAVVFAGVGAVVPRQRRRILVLDCDGWGRLTARAAADVGARRGTRMRRPR
jgi:hypothetical protein